MANKITEMAVWEAAMEQKSVWRFDGAKEADKIHSAMAKSLNAKGYSMAGGRGARGGAKSTRPVRGNDVRKFLAARGWMSGAIQYRWED